MIIFGLGSKVASSQPVPEICCEHCGQTSIHSNTLYRYFHLFWVPTFPYKKTREYECSHCKAVYHEKDVPQWEGSAVSTDSSRVPLSLFSGILLVFALVVFLEHCVSENKERYQAYVSAPALQDVYIHEYPKDSENYKSGLRYGILKVESLDDQRVLVRQGNYAYEYWSDASKRIRKGTSSIEDFYSDYTYSLTVDEIQEDYRKGVIKAVIRKKI